MEWLSKYAQKVNENKINAVKGSGAIGAAMFIIFSIYNKFSGQSMQDSIIFGLVIGVIFAIIWFIFSLNLAKREKAREEKVREEKIKAEKEAVAKQNKKSNKKKRK